jgi:hypothetical protein
MIGEFCGKIIEWSKRVQFSRMIKERVAEELEKKKPSE